MSEKPQDHKQQNRDEVSLYDRLLARTEVLLQGGRNNLEDALRKASEELSSLGSYTREQADRVSSYIKRDLLHATDKKETPSTGTGEQPQTTDKTSHFAQTVREAIDPKRVVTGAQSLFSKVVTSAAATLNEWGQKMEHSLEFRTGEITSPGTLTCKNCGEVMKIKETMEIPPCPQCGQKSFRKSY